MKFKLDLLQPTMSNIWTHIDCGCIACVDYADIQQRISTVDSGVARGLRSQVNALHDPLRRLPPEVIARVFEETQDHELASPIEQAMGLSAVCGYWRSIALATPVLWDDVDIYLFPYHHDNDFDLLLEIFQIILLRSKGVPLRLKISTDSAISYNIYVIDKFSALMIHVRKPEVIARLISLCYCLPRVCLAELEAIEALNLKTFSLQIAIYHITKGRPINLQRLAPQLERLVVSHANLSHIYLSCSKLLQLKATSCRLSPLISIMRQAMSSLRSADLDVETHPPVPIDNTTLTVLKELSSLWIFFQHGIAPLGAEFFDSFTFPALKDLRVGSAVGIDCPRLLSLLRRSHCSLTNLHIHNESSKMLNPICSWSIANLEEILFLFPPLTSLYLSQVVDAPLLNIFRTVLSPATSFTTPKAIVMDFKIKTRWTPEDSEDGWAFMLDLFASSAAIARGPVKINVLLSVDQGQCYLVPMNVIQKVKDLGWGWKISVMKDGQQPVFDLIDASVDHHNQLLQSEL